MNRNVVSDLSEHFYKEFVDARSLILLLAQLKDLKNVSLPKYQQIIHNATKIILDAEEMKNDDNELQKCFQELRTKILENNYDAVDFMLFNKF